eukprot:910950-Pleurochrysis_carterae.AAC.13
MTGVHAGAARQMKQLNAKSASSPRAEFIHSMRSIEQTSLKVDALSLPSPLSQSKNAGAILRLFKTQYHHVLNLYDRVVLRDPAYARRVQLEAFRTLHRGLKHAWTISCARGSTGTTVLLHTHAREDSSFSRKIARSRVQLLACFLALRRPMRVHAKL